MLFQAFYKLLTLIVVQSNTNIFAIPYPYNYCWLSNNQYFYAFSR